MKHQHTFTLIELLMTVAIVVILAGILVPAVMSGIKKGQQAKAKAEIVTLVNAIKQYENTYNKLPKYTEKTAMSVPENLIKALQGNGTITASSNKVNPRQISFLEKRNTGEGDFLDPWGHAYRIILNSDETILLTDLYVSTDDPPLTGAALLAKAKEYYKENDTIYQSVVIWSRGPDEKWDTKDDVHSFEAEYEAGQWHVTN